MDRMPPFTDYVAALRDEYPELAQAFAGWHGVEDVLQWLGRRDRGDVDIVGQDEFHYDFLVRQGAAGRWLSFGVT